MTATRLPLLCPGDWAMLDGEAAFDVLRVVKANHPSGDRMSPGTVIGARVLRPSFYPGMALAEVLLSHEENGASLVAIYDDDRITTFDGSSPPLHGLNDTRAISLQSEGDAIGYLCLFCSLVCGEDGAFYNVTSTDQIQLLDSPPDELAGIACRPHQVLTRPNGKESAWTIRTFVQYSHMLFAATFRIAPGGMTEMLDDEPLAQKLPALNQRFIAGVRVLRAAPTPDD